VASERKEGVDMSSPQWILVLTIGVLFLFCVLVSWIGERQSQRERKNVHQAEAGDVDTSAGVNMAEAPERESAAV
jgi:hypothetical protein